MKSLKHKISSVYLMLVLIIGIVGIVSVVNFYGLTREIEGLIVDNYNSLETISKMIEALERQDSAILIYNSGKKEMGLKSFEFNRENFYQYYEKASNNITEIGEEEIIVLINQHYNDYLHSFQQLEGIQAAYPQVVLMERYLNEITPKFLQLKEDLRALEEINETAMFRRKTQVVKNSQTSTKIIFFLSIVSVISGFVISRYMADKFTKPVEQLTKTMRLVEAGDIDKQIEITSNDEIGILAQEFNKMTERLLVFEESTLGKVITEKNKSVAIVKSISDPLMVLDNNYRVTLVNKAFEDCFHIKEKEAHNRYFFEIIYKENLYNDITSILDDEVSKHKENIFYFESDSNHYYFNIIVTKIIDTAADMKGVVVLFQNITELKELEKMKTNFISTISHEFKTPLTSIMMGTSLLNDGAIGELNKEQKNVLTSMEEDCQSLANLVDDLLYMSKIQSTKAVYDKKYTSIINVIQQAVKPFQPQAFSKKVKLGIMLSENLSKVYIDQEKITWVINNLIVNALKYTSEGDEISIYTEEKEEKIFITVKDTGIGIPQEYLGKIFHQFVQVEDSGLEVRGTGLGLSIAKDIVEAHGGEIWCESIIDFGSSFIFTLPIDNEKLEVEKLH
ncbi:alginate biosynthesis sensor protein KinB [Clostridium aceticum]|uniref:histidine kinase n=1 Tax=Clostridium aceticum TaxID=84022 RepID=A0A0D8I875_9CLOT|nr:ATP-binding protein [Clostridium aceticum]AKL94657.1 alginate biosynthesis sensor protein KinB [Clostridium aceticum]KJF26448.1 hypothetical protein TZ02_13010 [Clostridium aceticum]